jgi:LmbE family N-acetylglucosaminyl deacetylase
MNHLFCPLLAKDTLSGPVLALAAHPDDEVIGAGAMLAHHASQGHAVTVVHATDGAQGDPDGATYDIVATRRREGQEALARLGIGAPERWDLPDGGLPERLAELEQRVRDAFVRVQPKTLYSFWFGEAHRDHRAMAHAAMRAADALPPDCRCLLFGVNHFPAASALFDTSALWPKKRHALEAYASQNVYFDIPGLGDHRDRTATINVNVAGVTHCEMFTDLRPNQLARVHELWSPLHRLLLEGGS